MVAILLGTGFEEVEAISPCDLLRRAGVETRFVGLDAKTVVGGHGIAVEADCVLSELDPSEIEMVVLPGGLGGVNSILACDAAMELIEKTWNTGKYIAAICAAPTILAKLGITDGKQATCYPGMENQMGAAQMVPGAPAVRDGKLVTGRAAGTAMDFGLCLIETLRDADTAEQVKQSVFYCA